jgi:hypothetical protein
MVIPDEDHLRSDSGGLVDDRGDVAHAGHPGLINNDHGRRVDLTSLDDVAGDRRRPNARPRLQLAGGPSARRESDHGVPGSLVDGAQGSEGVGLAGPGAANHHSHPITRRCEYPNRVGLVRSECRCCDGDPGGARVEDAAGPFDPCGELIEELLLDREQCPRRVPVAAVVGYHPIVCMDGRLLGRVADRDDRRRRQRTVHHRLDRRDARALQFAGDCLGES